jgi:hypothetical protein
MVASGSEIGQAKGGKLAKRLDYFKGKGGGGKDEKDRAGVFSPAQ